MGFGLGLLAAFLGAPASSFGEADLMHHDIPRLPSFSMAFNGVRRPHSCGILGTPKMDGGKGKHKKKRQGFC